MIHDVLDHPLGLLRATLRATRRRRCRAVAGDDHAAPEQLACLVVELQVVQCSGESVGVLVSVERDLDAPLVAAARGIVPVVHEANSIAVPAGPRLMTRVGPISSWAPQDSWMWPQTASWGRLASIASRIAVAAQVVARARLVAVTLGRGVHDQDRAVRATGELLGRLLLVEVEAPVPRRDRDPRAETVELRAVDLGALAVQDGCGLPALTRGAQGVLGLVVARDEDRRCGDPPQRVDGLLEALVDRGEISGRDHDVDIGGALDQLCRLVEVAMKVAEGEQPHGPAVCHRPQRGGYATRRVGMSPGRR